MKENLAQLGGVAIFTDCIFAVGKTPRKIPESEGEPLVLLKLWRMQSTPLLPSPWGSFWLRDVAPDRDRSMCQKELTCVIMLNRIVWNRTEYMHKNGPWCNGYRRRNWTRRYKLKSWTRLISFHIALIPLGKVWIQLFSLQLRVNSRAD